MNWRRLLALTLLFISANLLATENLIVLGQPSRNEALAVPIDCPAEHICLNSWYRWTISVTRSVGGAPVRGRIHAVRLQPTPWRLRHREEYLFVLTPIREAAERKKFRADYYIEEVSSPYRMYCLDQHPLKVDAQVYSDADDQLHCFELANRRD